MSHFSASALAARLNRKIARRQRLARWGTALVVPTVAATIYLRRWNEWFVLGGVALLALEAIAIGAGRLQRCPFCDASLVIGRRGEVTVPRYVPGVWVPDRVTSIALGLPNER